jgi:hypothetical protein
MGPETDGTKNTLLIVLFVVCGIVGLGFLGLVGWLVARLAG